MPGKSGPQLSNGTLKLISLGIALLLEFYFYSQDNSVTQMVSALLEFQNVPQNRIIVDPPHAEQGIPAHLEVYGPKSIVEQISRGFHVLKVPFPEKAEFSFGIDVPYDSLRFPPSVNIVSAKPARISVRTVEMVRKEVPVKLVFEGELPEGYVLGDIQIFPRAVIVRGPFQDLQSVERIEPEVVKLNGLTSSVRAELRVKAPTELSSLNVNLVSLELEVKELEIERSIDAIEIVTDQQADLSSRNLSIAPATGSLTLKGPKSLLENLTSSDLSLLVEGLPDNGSTGQKGGAIGSGKFNVRAVLPPNVHIIKQHPREVTVTSRKIAGK
ncbi:MAG TPA: CdaR family protein [Oligoflexia bacterium]|nr:CdaR family protein [Oligoflexia bacterium]HMP48611.1 CdaR family protein [Oligoflexia bacterium]